MKNNQILLFLQETLQRLFTKSPLFFRVWTYISLALVLITSVPEIINYISGVITIPDLWNAQITLIVAWASRVALFMSLLTTQSKVTAKTEDGVLLKTTNDTSLPFTNKAEKKADTENLPVLY